MNYEETMDFLKKNIVEVEFTKVDGTVRKMQCTLMKDKIPPATKDPISQEKVRTVNENVVAVWDIEKEGWRSFRLDSVISMQGVIA